MDMTLEKIRIGVYEIPDDCRAVILESGRKLEVRKKKERSIKPDEARCFRCKHYVSGHSVLHHFTTMVCDAKPKTLSDALEKIKANHPIFKDYVLYYSANRYDKACEKYEPK